MPGTIASSAGLAFVRAYRVCLSPLLPPCCRFVPTCSRYAEVAIRRFGLLRGGWLTIKRLGRCQPFYHGMSYDPVPERGNDKVDGAKGS